MFLNKTTQRAKWLCKTKLMMIKVQIKLLMLRNVKFAQQMVSSVGFAKGKLELGRCEQ